MPKYNVKRRIGKSGIARKQTKDVTKRLIRKQTNIDRILNIERQFELVKKLEKLENKYQITTKEMSKAKKHLRDLILEYNIMAARGKVQIKGTPLQRTGKQKKHISQK
ncbi:MAG TPA: hypothetical protein PKI29_02280 [archaeon]|jgi:hypothetical protein|nr:hypothetical protein [archaeon]